jgi:predicted RNase H-like nuclease (RuvC/YqgF family)
VLVLQYLGAGAGFAAIVSAFIALGNFISSRRERADAHRRKEWDAGREATNDSFRRQGQVIERLDAENSRLSRRVDELEDELTTARTLYAHEMGRMREQIKQLLAREA